MLVTIIAWIILGAIAGYIARALIPGDQGLGVMGTIILGIVGAFVGGLIAYLITGNAGPAGGGDVVNIPSIIMAVIGAVIVVFIAGKMGGRSRVA